MFKNLFSSGRKDWYKVNLLDFATIDFPKKPQLHTSEKGITQIGYNDNINFYIVDIEDISNYGLDIKSDELEDLYNGIIVGFFENPENKALVKKKFNVDALIGIEIIF